MDKKELVAREALKYLREGDVVGLGSGTTAAQFIKCLGGSKLRNSIIGVSTSISSEKLAREMKVRTVDIDSVEWIDITVDGADQVDKDMNILKGGGGQLTREKKVRNKSKKYLIIVSDEKLVDEIPADAGIPVEVLPFGHGTTMQELENLGMSCRYREDFITDNGNLVCDCKPLRKFNLQELDQNIKRITGVVETGLFLGGNKTVLVSNGEKVEILR